MQDAFAIEKNAIGDWAEIGYTAPGTKQSNDAAGKSHYKSNEFEYQGAATGVGTSAWVAKANNKLNDCNSGSTWTLNAVYNSGNEGSVEYTHAYSDPTNCKALTPAFDKLGTAATGS